MILFLLIIKSILTIAIDTAIKVVLHAWDSIATGQPIPTAIAWIIKVTADLIKIWNGIKKNKKSQ
ncbi:hypothetical protein BLX88_26025 [Bacillus obstructivus]|uniref:hypothetical protein n=1 Tax=Heyndrickxia sp. FSL W8-0496 TaxID=2954702 RepID=UPI0009042FE3|nr:hypothetical protein BLX88_26025 [Bacillus obstructivus]